jgi:hypothetical protein
MSVPSERRSPVIKLSMVRESPQSKVPLAGTRRIEADSKCDGAGGWASATREKSTSTTKIHPENIEGSDSRYLREPTESKGDTPAYFRFNWTTRQAG